ncbi:GHKL domain-containing protein [Blautia schinkii]|nr:GHKL domain-containing protein [Blautia schinkii]
MREALLLAIGRLVCTVPWFVICCVPFYPQRRVSRRTMALTITTASVVFFLCNYCLRLRYEDYATWGSSVFFVMYIVLLALFMWGFKVAFVKLLYVFLLVQAVSTCINYTAAIILRPFYPEVRISLQNTPAYILMILLLTIAIAPAVWYFFCHRVREAMKELRNGDFWSLCVPPVLIFIVTLIFSDIAANPVIPQGQAIVIFLLISATGLATYYLNVRLVLDVAVRARLEADMAAMERQIGIQAQNYTQLTQSIEAAREARHDFRHHLTVLSGFADKKDWEGLSEYLAEYAQSLPDDHYECVCQNYVVDVVVRHYLQIAKEAGAQLDVKLDLSVDIGIADKDLTVVFGNLFENAAHEVARQTGGRKFIRARCGIENGKFILTLDNSVEPTPSYRKKERKAPGIGQTSVKAVAEKYQGTVRFEQGVDAYQASVLLVCEDK